MSDIHVPESECPEELNVTACGGKLHTPVYVTDSCNSVRIEGVDDVTINQGVGIDLTEGVVAYDGEGNVIPYTVEPDTINKCEVGEHEVHYTATGIGTPLRPKMPCIKRKLHMPDTCAGDDFVSETRIVTIEQADPPTIEGIDTTRISPNTDFDPSNGVSATDDNGNDIPVEYVGIYSDQTEQAEIVEFDTDISAPLVSVEVTLEPVQECTPWIGTDKDTEPYQFRAMPTQSNDYNREADTLVGGSVAWNQKLLNGNFENTNNWATASGVNFSVSDNIGKLTIETAAGAGRPNLYQTNAVSINPIIGHKYLIAFDYKISSSTDTGLNVLFGSNLSIASHVTLGAWTSVRVIKEVTATTYGATFYLYLSATLGYWTVGDTIEYRNVQLIDLTALFSNATIADYIYTLEQGTAGAGVAFFRKLFPNEYYPYSSGELKSVEGVSAHIMRDASNNIIGSYPLDSTLTLRGVPKLSASNQIYFDGDRYESDGTVTRRYGIVDLGTLNWTYTTYTGTSRFFVTLSDIKSPSVSSELVNAICMKYVAIKQADNWANSTGVFCVTTAGQLNVLDSNYSTAAAFKTAMSGVYLVYELATPTTEQTDPFQSPQVADPSGTEEYVTSGIVPVGHESTYSLVCPISGWNEVTITLADDHDAPITSTDYTTDLGQTVYGGMLDVVSGKLTVTWAEVDLGEIGASYNTAWHCWVVSAGIAGAKVVSSNTVPMDAIASNMVAVAANGYTSSHNAGTFAQNINGFLFFDNGSTEALNGTLVYELATPVTYQLTAQQIEALLGDNVVWTDDAHEVRVKFLKTTSGGTIQYSADGMYPIVYTAEDECGNRTEELRTIIVSEDNYDMYTILFADGTLAFNVPVSEIDDYIAQHGYSVHLYPPLDENHDYEFEMVGYGTSAYWYSNRSDVLSVEFASPIAPTNTALWFHGCYNMTSIDFTNLNTSNVTDMHGMFYSCGSMEEFNLTSFDTSNVEYMHDMFAFCTNLKRADLSSFDTSNVQSMQSMFRYCESLEEVDMSSFDLQSVTSLAMMFQSCSSLRSMDISNFVTPSLQYCYEMFNRCTAIETITFGAGFDTSHVSSASSMFSYDTSLTTIYSPIDWTLTSSSYSLFSNCTSLVGGNGTTYASNRTGREYARIDTAENIGYFTDPT